MRKLILASLIFTLLANLPAAHASIVFVDQQSTRAGSSSSVGVNTGIYNAQSFTPTLNLINAATFSLQPSNIYDATETSIVIIDLYTGGGINGNVLASSAPVTVTGTGFHTYEFDFAQPVFLTPGSLYTLALRQAGGTGGLLASEGNNNPYAGGMFYVITNGYPDLDMVFSEGTTFVPSVAPEPSTWVLVGLGTVAMGIAAMRPRRVVRG